MSRKSSAHIALEMRRAIEGGTYRHMERLPASRELAASLGVARNTLRDALYQLEKQGLLETRAGSGTYVTAAETNVIPYSVKEATPLELIDARFALERHICRLCVLHGRREDFEALYGHCDAMEAAREDPVLFSDIDTQFHQALAEATRNRLLIWLIDQINMVRSLDEWTQMRNVTLDKHIIELYNRQHRAIVDAIRAREPERAALIMKDHLETARLSLTRAAEA